MDGADDGVELARRAPLSQPPPGSKSAVCSSSLLARASARASLTVTAKQKLGWTPRTTFKQLVKLMMESDLALAEREQRAGVGPAVSRHG